MMAQEFVQIDPRKLRLPRSRAQGADPVKLQRQIAKHGNSTQGMPHPWVSRDKNGELQILDGVTRATRVAKLLPGQEITVEVSDEASGMDYSTLPLLGDHLP
jgi:hypothetical protein